MQNFLCNNIEKCQLEFFRIAPRLTGQVPKFCIWNKKTIYLFSILKYLKKYVAVLKKIAVRNNASVLKKNNLFSRKKIVRNAS